MKSFAQRQEAANALQAPYAIPLNGGLGRTENESADETRFPFQRDRDRIIHTHAFRRLKGKTQVFLTGEGDHYRTRLTHTMEVAQISRDIARTLSLNEDLAECIALAHDLGHPPFGHAGEDALDAWMKNHGGHFEHNEQSHRIVTLLEQHSTRFSGLNLNGEVLEGLLKHSTPHDAPAAPQSHHAPSLEAQIVNVADEIAYTGHDCEDGLRAALFSLNDIEDADLARRALERTKNRGTSLRGALIHMLVMDLYAATEVRLREAAIETLDDVLKSAQPLIVFSRGMRSDLDHLRSFLWMNMYLHPKVQERNSEGKEIVLSLCTRLHDAPSQKVLELQERTSGPLHEAVKDYVAGMTDAYAVEHNGTK